MSNDPRNNIRTGDLLIWSNASGQGGGVWLKIVRFLTVSDFGHVSVAWKQGDSLFHVEAVMPRIRVTKVPKDSNFYVLPMSTHINAPEDMNFFNDKIGSKYSIFDAIRAYLGISTQKDDQWQCAELTEAYYRDQGIDIDLKFLTPTRLVKELMSIVDTSLYRVNKVF